MISILFLAGLLLLFPGWKSAPQRSEETVCVLLGLPRGWKDLGVGRDDGENYGKVCKTFCWTCWPLNHKTPSRPLKWGSERACGIYDKPHESFITTELLTNAWFWATIHKERTNVNLILPVQLMSSAHLPRISDLGSSPSQPLKHPEQLGVDFWGAVKGSLAWGSMMYICF